MPNREVLMGLNEPRQGSSQTGSKKRKNGVSDRTCFASHTTNQNIQDMVLMYKQSKYLYAK